MNRLARDIFLMALATGISRVLGLFREVSIADRFGASAAYDAFVIAFSLPAFLRELLAEGALSTAFVPIYTDALVADKDANRFVNNVLSLLVVLFPIVVAGGILLAPHYLPFLASGFPQEKLALSIRLAQVLFPFVMLIGFAAVFMGILQTHHRFFIASFAPVLYNVGMIIGALFLAPRFSVHPIYGLALGVLLGGLGQLAFQLPTLRRIAFHFRFTLTPLHPGIRQMGRLMFPVVLALSVAQINLLVDNKLASHLGDGGISSLQYAMRLFQLPLGVFAVSIGTALLPRFAAALTRDEHARFHAQLTDGIRLTAFILLPAMAGLFAIGPNIIRLLFEHGQFTSSDTLRTTKALWFYVVGIFPYGLVYLFTRACYAMQRTKILVLTACCAVGTNVTFDLLLVGPLREGGLALATSLAGTINALILALFLWKRFQPYQELLKHFGKTIVGAAIVFSTAWATQRGIDNDARILSVFLPILSAIVCYIIYARVSGLWNLIRSRPSTPRASR
jgi:putative peptidoglycan lipid II flippase